MSAVLAPIGYAIGLWWFSTGVILFLNHLPPRSFRASLTGATVVLVASLVAIGATAGGTDVHAAYLAFTFAVLAWGWQEMTFFMGAITGPRRSAGPPNRGWTRFWHASQTCLYHEAACATGAGAIWLLTLHHPNQVALWTYLSLWLMRLSAKLNVFLGIRNLNEQWLPRRLAYLASYMTRRRGNTLLPVSLAAGTAAALWMGAAAMRAATPFGAAAHALVAALLALGVIEHGFMVIPLPFAHLWSGFSRRCPAEPVARALTSPILATNCLATAGLERN